MTDIVVGMTGSQVRSALNTNFDTLDNKTFINVKEYGAIGDGETDDKMAISDCLTAAQGKTIYFPSGTYKITGGLTITLDDPVTIYGENAILLGDSVSTGVSVLGISASVGDIDYLTADVDSGNYTATPTNPDNFATGDFVILKDDVILRSLEGNNIYNGEILQILSITNGVIRFHTPVMGNYLLTENVGIKKINSNPVIISGLQIIGGTGENTSMCGLQIFNRANVNIHNNIASKCGLGGIVLNGCINGTVYGNYVFDCYVAGNGYGITINSSKFINVFDCNITECRHCIVTGGSYPNYNINIHNNIVASSTVVVPSSNGAISAHFFDYYITIKDNVVFGDGIFSLARSYAISGNTIYITENNQMGINAYFHTMYAASVIIENNNFIQLRDDVVGNTAIRLDSENNDVTIKSIIIQNNTTDGFSSDINLFTSSFAGIVINNLIIKNNNFNSSQVFNDFVSTDITVGTAVIEGNIFKSTFWFIVDSITNLTFKNNQITQSIAGKLLYLSAITHAIVSDNIFDSNTDDECVTIANITTLIFMNNVIKNCTAENAVLLDTIVNLINQGNSIDNCSNAISKVSITNDQSGTNFTY